MPVAEPSQPYLQVKQGEGGKTEGILSDGSRQRQAYTDGYRRLDGWADKDTSCHGGLADGERERLHGTSRHAFAAWPCFFFPVAYCRVQIMSTCRAQSRLTLTPTNPPSRFPHPPRPRRHHQVPVAVPLGDQGGRAGDLSSGGLVPSSGAAEGVPSGESVAYVVVVVDFVEPSSSVLQTFLSPSPCLSACVDMSSLVHARRQLRTHEP